MNYNTYIVYDYESSSKSSETTQPVQLAAVAVHGRKLEIIEGSEFQSLIRPVFDEAECSRLGLDPLEDGAVQVHGKTAEILAEAPPLESVWPNFVEYVNSYNWKGTQWTAPIPVGYNIKGFDTIITNRICLSEPYKLGPVNKKGNQGLFHAIHSIDMLDFMFTMFEDDKEISSLSADRLIRGHMGYAKGQAHDAMSDVIMTAELFIRTMKMLRSVAKKKNFKGCMS